MTPRNRAHCPTCGSITVDRKLKEGKWKCRQCGWIDVQPIMKPQDSWEISKQDDVRWIKHLHELHNEHPEYTRADLRKYGMMGDGIVNRYWKMFVVGKVHVIKPWSGVI